MERWPRLSGSSLNDDTIESMIDTWGHRNCHYLTIALHRLTGWPIRTLVEYPGDRIIHSAVEHPEGGVVDVYGHYPARHAHEVGLRYPVPRTAWEPVTAEGLVAATPASEDPGLLEGRIDQARHEPIAILLSEVVPAINDARREFDRQCSARTEIELVCANAEYFGEERAREMALAYRRLFSAFEFVRLAPPAELDFDYTYLECSVFVRDSEVDRALAVLRERGYEVDVVHAPRAVRSRRGP